jgi:N-acyl-D-aspartate/D-glutamate deacylase
MCLGLDLSFNPFSFHPSYREIAALPLSERVNRMRDPGFRSRLLAETPVSVPPALARFTTAYPTMFGLGEAPNYEPAPDQRISALAERRGVSAAEIAYDLLLEDDGRGILYFPVTNFHDGNLDIALEIMRHDDMIIALGDGGAHYGLICDASYPTFALTHWVRDRDGERLSLPWMINALTRKPALAVGLADRGLIGPGYKADINVIDFEALELHKPEVRYDLPAGGRRMVQKADGYVTTLVSGQTTYRHGIATGDLPGRLLRYARPDSAQDPPPG